MVDLVINMIKYMLHRANIPIDGVLVPHLFNNGIHKFMQQICIDY